MFNFQYNLITECVITQWQMSGWLSLFHIAEILKQVCGLNVLTSRPRVQADFNSQKRWLFVRKIRVTKFRSYESYELPRCNRSPDLGCHLSAKSLEICINILSSQQTESVSFIPQANSTDRATATCRNYCRFSSVQECGVDSVTFLGGS